ncbi:MAG: hypothetical protein WCJ72_09105 [Chryseobacterium sp.]
MDLNKVSIPADYNDFNGQMADYSCESSGKYEIYFRNLEDAIIRHIDQASYVYGCVAWLTNFKILNALQNTKNVGIVVQKEDFLRPDTSFNSKSGKDWKTDLRKAYTSLPGSNRQLGDKDDIRHAWHQIDELSDHKLDAGLRKISYLNFSHSWDWQPVRCMGNYNREKNPAFPRMHNKFLIFCNEKHTPYGVWTGSCNLSENSNKSLENAIYLEGKEAVWAYFNEFQQIFALSEPLDWEQDWCQPEFRIGT